jgi:hypothetical protein
MKLLIMQSSPTHYLLQPVTVLSTIIWNILSLQSERPSFTLTPNSMQNYFTFNYFLFLFLRF